jgi:hypothetical protein
MHRDCDCYPRKSEPFHGLITIPVALDNAEVLLVADGDTDVGVGLIDSDTKVCHLKRNSLVTCPCCLLVDGIDRRIHRDCDCSLTVVRHIALFARKGKLNFNGGVDNPCLAQSMFEKNVDGSEL